MNQYEKNMYSTLPQLFELRRQGKRIELQSIEVNMLDLIEEQIDLEQSCTVDIKDVQELQVRDIK